MNTKERIAKIHDDIAWQVAENGLSPDNAYVQAMLLLTPYNVTATPRQDDYSVVEYVRLDNGEVVYSATDFMYL